MTRRKAEITARLNERDYPYMVELPLPPGGFRTRSDAMLAFHRERGIQIRRGQGRNDDGALRLARIKVMGDYPHPSFWSAFIYIGDPARRWAR